MVQTPKEPGRIVLPVSQTFTGSCSMWYIIYLKAAKYYSKCVMHYILMTAFTVSVYKTGNNYLLNHVLYKMLLLSSLYNKPTRLSCLLQFILLLAVKGMDNSSRKNNVTVTFTIPSTLIPSFCSLMCRICKWNSRNSNNCIPPELISCCYSLLINSQHSIVLCKELHYHSDTQEISGLLWNSDIQCYMLHSQSPLIPVSFLISRCILILLYHFHRVWSPV